MELMLLNAPADVTIESFLETFKRHLETVEKKMTEVFEKAARETIGRDAEEKERYMALLTMRAMDGIMAAAHEACGMDPMPFQGCLFKFQNDPGIAKLVNESQQRQAISRDEFLAGK
jgi:hypothetical protein